MTAFSASLLGASPSGGRRLVNRGSLDPLVTLTRAEPASRSTAPGADGASWAEGMADTPHFAGIARRLLLGGARGNGIRNPRAEGAQAGNPGTLPLNWTTSMPAGVSREVVGTGSEGGIAYVALRFLGTAGAAGPLSVTFESLTQLAGVPGEVWTISAFARRVAGTAPGGGLLLVIERDAAGTFLSSGQGTATPGTGALASQRFSLARLLSNAGTQRVSARFDLATVTAGAVVDVTWRVGWPQLEKAAFASTPILPLAGSPAASARGADLVSAGFASLFPSGAGTLLLSAVLPQAAPSAADQTLLQLDDGTDANRLTLRNQGGGLSIGLLRALAGATATAVAGTMTAGTPFRIAAAFNAGRLAASLEGGAVVAVGGGPTSGLTTLRIGNRADAAAATFGEIGGLTALPFAVPDGALPSLSTSF